MSTLLKRAMAHGREYMRCHASELTVKETYIAILSDEVVRLRRKLPLKHREPDSDDGQQKP